MSVFNSHQYLWETFRTEASLGNSLLSDIGCYPISLLAIAGYDLSNLGLEASTPSANQRPIFFASRKSHTTNIHIEIGHDGLYRNNLKLEFDDDQQVSCEPFFYGRRGHRNLIRATSAGILTEKIHETNSYERMFRRKRSEWRLATQESRSASLCSVSESLKLGRQAGML